MLADVSREPPSGKGPDGQLRLGRGDVVGERWRLDEFLKGGGMGRVWRATDLRLLEPVAVKLMDPAGLAAEGARERFFREAQAAARLRGPNVVQVLDFDVDPGTHIPYLAMELLHGEDLAERLARGKLGFTETLAILADVCSAITRAHRLEIVHRDLKPANVFIVDGEDPVCKVLDFGIVKLSAAALAPPEGQLTLSGAALGTVSYMSPEQIADAQRVDHRADLWSIGVLAYECLTGRRPGEPASRRSTASALIGCAGAVPRATSGSPWRTRSARGNGARSAPTRPRPLSGGRARSPASRRSRARKADVASPPHT